MAAPPEAKTGIRKTFLQKWEKITQKPSPTPPPPTRGSVASSSLAPNHLISATDAIPETDSALWPKLRAALRALQSSISLFPPLYSAVGMLIPCLDILEDATKHQHEYENLTSELISLSELLARHMKEPGFAPMLDSIMSASSMIEKHVTLIANKQKQNAGRRLINTRADEEELIHCYRQIQNSFRRLQTDAVMNATRIVAEQQMDGRLAMLAPAKLANFDSTLSTEINRRTCTEHTRKAILSDLGDWSYNPNVATVYWMNGMAGTGKTTIACTFSKLLKERKQLAASFFCTRTSPECRDANRIIPTIAYQLSRFSFPFRTVLCEALGEDPDIGLGAIPKQFEQLLKLPLLKVKDAIPNNLVVVVDALDECTNKDGTRLVVETLIQFAVDLPIKFFITSRPEPETYERIRSGGHGSRTILHLHDIERSLVQADIALYLEEELAFMSPTPHQTQELARRSGNLFIFAATLVRYIRPPKRSINPQKRLTSVLATSSSYKLHAEIDELYTIVLSEALDEDGLEPDEAENVRLVLWTAVCAQEPASVETIGALAGLEDTQETLVALEALRSVIHFSESSGLVSTFHASFPDFMFSKERSGPFYCDSAGHNQRLAHRCFDIMRKQLRFNICRLESSFVLDDELEDLQNRVGQFISPALSYACHHWGNHLQPSVCSEALCTLLTDFLSTRLLFWMEVLNMKHTMRLGVLALLKTKRWLTTAKPALPEIARLTEDARDFVTSFAANAIAQSTPHIYISAIPFCPRSSMIFKCYREKIKGTMDVAGSLMQKRELAALATWNITSPARSISYSPDGSHIAFGWGGTVGVRNAHGGEMVVGPCEGHTGLVTSVVYSPDGMCIASGSADRSIRIWHSQNGTMVAGPLEGHTDLISSIAYSPDGQRVASGSQDCTIRVWSVHNGTLIAGPFQGHTGGIRSIAYSPDGTRIASGSRDHTVRLWNASDGALASGPLEGHTDCITCVVYSPDGMHVASSSLDRTIRVWNTRGSAVIAGPFKGSTSWVLSLAYSPDGTRIACGFNSSEVKIFDAQDGTFIAGPFEGHTKPVVSVAYSPDGMCIASSSLGCTIQVWNAQRDVVLPDSFRGHTGWILSLAYSPDGTRIASSSEDHIIRVWNAQDGTPIASLSTEHTDWITSIAFSPDGTLIASGSHDRTVQIRNVHTGSRVDDPFEGHTGWVTSVAYAPNGRYIASGSNDCTIRVWNTLDRNLALSPLEGHTKWVTSVAFSPNSERLVSGSTDCTVRVWNTQDGSPITGPIEGHTDLVTSVSYSPDGTRIASGSGDRTIRVWDALTGTPASDPFCGHTDSVRSVRYLADGTRIVSGSNDRTIRIWSTHDGTPAAGPFEGHTDYIMSLACSPDGTRVATGSSDTAIRVWKLPPAVKVDEDSKHDPPSGKTETVSHVTNQGHFTPFGGWRVRGNRWITDNDMTPYFWVPPDIIHFLPNPHNDLIITHFDCVQANYDGVLIGEDWHNCYVLEDPA